MIVDVKVMLRHPLPLREMAVCRVEVRDVTLLDARSITVDSYKAQVSTISGQTVLEVSLDVPDSDAPSRDYNVWAHLSLTGAGQVQAEDYITTCAYPVPRGVSRAQVIVELQPVSPAAK